MSRKESIEFSLAGGPFHRSLPRYRQRSARRRVGQASSRDHVTQPATNERGAEAIPSPRRIELLDLEPRLSEARRRVEIAGAFRAALVNDRSDAVGENLFDGALLFFRISEEIEFDAARQEHIATSKQG